MYNGRVKWFMSVVCLLFLCNLKTVAGQDAPSLFHERSATWMSISNSLHRFSLHFWGFPAGEFGKVLNLVELLLEADLRHNHGAVKAFCYQSRNGVIIGFLVLDKEIYKIVCFYPSTAEKPEYKMIQVAHDADVLAALKLFITQPYEEGTGFSTSFNTGGCAFKMDDGTFQGRYFRVMNDSSPCETQLQFKGLFNRLMELKELKKMADTYTDYTHTWGEVENRWFN